MRATVVGSHTPMSERQQLALIKQLEKSGGSSSTSSDCSPCITSPPRTPLGVLNSDLSTPNSRPGTSARLTSKSVGNTPRTPAEERVYKKVTKKNHRGETALQCAAIKGNLRLVRKLLRLGADPNCKDNAGWTPLHEACNRGNFAVAHLLIKAGSMINVPGMFKETPLHDAARNGHYKVVKLLVKSGADSTALNEQKKTPLEVAASPENPCENQDLEKVIKFLGGDYQDEEEIEESNSSPTQQQEKLASQSNTPTRQPQRGRIQLFSSSSMSNSNNQANTNSEEVTSSNQKEDVYEFKTSSKEATPTSSRGSASPGNAAENNADKRSADDEDDSGNKSKRKKDDSGGGGGGGAGGRGRGVRGNSSDKGGGGGKQGGRGRGGAGNVGGGATSTERRSPPARLADNSPAPSPGKGKQPKNEQLAAAGAESDEEGDKKEGGLKVPPLKIVLNNGSNNRDEDKKKGSYIVNNTDEQEGGEASGNKSGEGEGASGGEEKTGTRVTRSRGGVGTEDEAPTESQNEEDRKQTNEYVMKKIKKRNQQGEEQAGTLANGCIRPSGEPLTDIEKHLNIRKQIEQRRKNLFPVQPKPPHGFRDYLMNKKTYHLQGNTGKDSRIQPIPKIAPPPSLDGPFRELFLTQENERYKLRMKHLVEKEKLVLAVEQEILRVHGRAARALANQSLPYSVCTILRDREIYTTIDPNQEEKNRDIRSRYNGRLFFSWLQDVDDKWEKIKEQMVLRHHNEAESLNAVQKMDWEWKLGEFPGNKAMTRPGPSAGDLHVPMVQVSDDFDQLLS